MIFNSFFTQIVMAILAIGIIFTYVQPTFTKIGTLQESIVKYQEERGKVAEVNAKLSALTAKVNEISSEDLKSLFIYLPDQLDHVAISRDILTISEEAETYLQDISYEGITKDSPNDSDPNIVHPIKHTFSVTLLGSYDQTKKFLLSLEQNNYPLEVRELSITSSETGIISSDMTINTYSHN